MTRHLVFRFGAQLLGLLIFVTVVFFLMHALLPFDAATRAAIGGQEAFAARQAELGLDRPLLVQFTDYMSGLFTLDLGLAWGGSEVPGSVFGYTGGASVSSVLRQAVPFTALVFGFGAVFAYLLGSWLGRIATWQRRPFVTGGLTGVAVALYSLFPPFLVFLLVRFLSQPLRETRAVLGLPSDTLDLYRDFAWSQETVLLVVLATLGAGLVVGMAVSGWLRRAGHQVAGGFALPASLMLTVAGWYVAGFGDQGIDIFFRGVRGVSIGRGSPVLGIVGFVLLAFGEILLIMRTGMAGESLEQYVVTARAKGLRERIVRDRHVARNATLPALTRFVTSIPYLLTGLIIIERELELPGLAQVLLAAAENADTPTIIGTLVALGVVLVVLRTALEVVEVVLDPRLRRPAATR